MQISDFLIKLNYTSYLRIGATLPDLAAFSKKHDLKLITIDSLKKYILRQKEKKMEASVTYG